MRNNLKYYTFLFIFFIVVALGSLFVLNGSGSVFDRSAESFGADEAVLQDIVIGTEADVLMEEAAEYEAVSGEKTEEAPQAVEVASEEVTIAKPEPEPELEVTQEPVTEPEVVEVTQPQSETTESGVEYYTYTVATSITALRLRSEADINSKVLANLEKNSTGYILQPGNGWCKVYTKSGKTGYLATEFLIVDKVTKEDFPEEIQDKVEKADEELSSAFEGNG